MTIKGNDGNLIADIRMSSRDEDVETLETRAVDVRSIVERQYSLMEQVHDRIRSEELAAHHRERFTS